MSNPGQARSEVVPQPVHRQARVVVIGNPNAGKSTLFNALTGGNARSGNFPGTTVSAVIGRVHLEGLGAVELVDLPGTYSLAADAPDEVVTMDALLGRGGVVPDAVLVVADGPRLLRSLYLTLQVLELGLPVLVAVNLLDEARAEGLEPNLPALSAALGVPVVGTIARTRVGVTELKQAMEQVLSTRQPAVAVHDWPETLERDVTEVAAALPAVPAAQARAIARWHLLSGVEGAASEVVSAVRHRAAAAGRDLETELVATRYAWIDARGGLFLRRTAAIGRTRSERIDRVMLHPLLGPLLFLAVASAAFTALFSGADPMIGLVETAFGALGGLVSRGFDLAAGSAPGLAGVLTILRDLVVDGVIGGVGGVLVFLPQIALLFLFLALLEDSGYLARAAHLVDRILRAAGLPGRAFVPVLSGYACAVPAILATRTMPRFRDRLLTMLVLPLTSCSARLPVYTLIIAAVFPTAVFGWVPLRPLALAGLYAFSTLLTVLASIVIGRTVLRDHQISAVLELPPYRVPDLRVVLRTVWSRCADFVREAGGIILLATILIWGLLYFPRTAPESVLSPEVIAEATAAGDDIDALVAPYQLERSFGGRIGHAMAPVIAPLGYDWQIGVGLLGAFAAREVFVSTMGVVYGIGADVDETSSSLRERLRTEKRADGTLVYTPLTGLSLLVFFAIALQCLSTLAVLRKETGSWRWPAVVFASNTALAWTLALFVYQGGRWLGFS